MRCGYKVGKCPVGNVKESTGELSHHDKQHGKISTEWVYETNKNRVMEHNKRRTKRKRREE